MAPKKGQRSKENDMQTLRRAVRRSKDQTVIESYKGCRTRVAKQRFLDSFKKDCTFDWIKETKGYSEKTRHRSTRSGRWMTQTQLEVNEGYTKTNPDPKALRAARAIMAKCKAKRGRVRECPNRAVPLYKVCSEHSDSEFEEEKSRKVEEGRDLPASQAPRGGQN
eukprot:12551134-Alexandrium_andersonii.AAC.2